MTILQATYYYQKDNLSGYGDRECCGTSNAALANTILNNQFDLEAERIGLSQPEQIYLDKLCDFGDTTDHDANTRCLRTFGIESAWFTNLRNEDFFKSIAAKIPMVLGFKYKEWGHIVLGIGHENESKIIVNDPFGSRRDSSDSWISTEPGAGRGDVYSINTFNELWEGNLGGGYGRVVYSVNGKATGL